MRRQNAHFAFVTHKLEDVFNRGLAGVAQQGNLKAQVAALRVHLRQRWQGIAQGFNGGNTAQRLQVADKGQRVHAVLQHLGAKAQRDMPVIAEHPLAINVPQFCFILHLDDHRSCHLCAQQQVQLRQQGQALLLQLGIGLFLAGGNALHQGLDMVATRQQQRHQRRIDFQLAGAQLVQQVFHHMGKGHHMV